MSSLSLVLLNICLLLYSWHGISSFNVKQQVPNDIPEHNAQQNHTIWKHTISNLAEQYPAVDKSTKMIPNEKKTKNMIFNFTENYRFITMFALKDEPIEVVSSTKLLGTFIIEDDLNFLKMEEYLIFLKM